MALPTNPVCVCGHAKTEHRRDGQCLNPACRRCKGFKANNSTHARDRALVDDAYRDMGIDPSAGDDIGDK